jgi:hypothetical protein
MPRSRSATANSSRSSTVFALLLDTSVTLVERRLIVGRPT